MKIPKEIAESHIAYYFGEIKIKYRGKRINDNIVSKKDFYDINIYSTEISTIVKANEKDYENLKQECIELDLCNVLIEKPGINNELFQEDLSKLKIYEYSTHSFVRDQINYGVIKGRVIFQIPYTITKIDMVDELVPEQKADISIPKIDTYSDKKNTTKATASNSNGPVVEPFNFFGCLFDLIGIIIALFVLIMALFFFIKVWKAALILFLIFGVAWLFSYFGNYIFKALKYLFIGGFIILLISILYTVLSRNTHRPKPVVDETVFIVEDDNVPVWENTEDFIKSDSINCDTIIEKDEVSYKTLAWRDYNENYHSFKYKISKQAYDEAKYNRANFVSYNNDWSQVYYNLYRNDFKYLKSFIEKYDALKSNLTRTEFAELIVSSIQYQPYVWILDVSCNSQNYKYKIAQSGCSCLGFITRYAVQSPYEYITNQKGDCDTRSLVLYSILKYYKYDVVILTSDYYEHAIIGINIPSYGKYKTYRGKKYYVWETTAQDMRIGQLNASVSNMNLWKVTL